MKSLFALLALTLSTWTLAGCSGEDKPAPPGPDAPKAPGVPPNGP